MSENHTSRVKIFGQDPAILEAMYENIKSWVVSSVGSFLTLFGVTLSAYRSNYLMDEPIVDNHEAVNDPKYTKCVSIARPGGMEQLRVITLKENVATIGYNVPELSPAPYTPPIVTKDLPSDCVVIRNKYFSVNYADCTIRWGLYESAKRFVGWPIVPGFDVSGVIETKGKDVTEFRIGDEVFGCSLFGAYSSRIVIPAQQLRILPKNLTSSDAAALPAVSLTALYALKLADFWPLPSKYKNKAVLIHSCAGGVGSMLVQMAKILNLHPIVGVVGRTSKVNAAKALGCDIVIDKSKQDLWVVAKSASPKGYAAIFDANGVATLKESYENLAPTGRLIVYGFHTNLPNTATLNPFEWLRMAKKMLRMPHFDPMDLTVENKSVLGFNLSFFADEREVLNELFDQVCDWLNEGKLHTPNVVEMAMSRVCDAHTLIQSGTSVGKIVLSTEE